MSKGAKIFVNILYYILTFSIGVLIAITIPAAMIYSYSMKDIQQALTDKEYDKAMQSLGGYYDKSYNYLSPNKDLVLFNAITLIYNSGEEGDDLVDGSKVHKSYCGYYFNIPSEYKTAGEDDNQTRLMITDKEGKEVKYNLIDYDYDQDGTFDSISTLVNYHFIFFEIPIENSSSIKKLDFYDNQGLVFYSIEFDQALEFSEQFFIDVDDFVEEYNRDYTSAKLLELDEEFLGKSESYAKSSNGDAVKKVNRRVSLYVVLYFVLIYLIGDSLIGGRFVYKGIKWLIRKLFKKKVKENTKVSKKQAECIGDIYSNLTIELDVEDDFLEPVTITYSNESEDIEFNLVKEDGYKQSKRVKAGTYVNMKVLMSNDYEVINPEQVLDVKRFNEKVNVKIRRREGEKG